MLFQTLFLLACLALLGALCIWGLTVHRLTLRIERRMPAVFEELRLRSRKGGRRLAVTSEIQKAMGGGGVPLPDAVLNDPVCAPLIAAEGRLRLAMLIAGGVAAMAFMGL